MKRSYFLASLFGVLGIARGQNNRRLIYLPPQKGCPPNFYCESGTHPPNWSLPIKPVNNQCPVCGTMAEPFKQEKRSDYEEVHRCDPPDPDHSALCATPHYVYGPTEQMIRCKRCNCAFWQDAELSK